MGVLALEYEATRRMRKRDLTLAILAGGRGRRLGGVPKGLIELQGQALIERLVALGQGFAEVILLTNDPSPYARFGLSTIADPIPDRGAPGGLYAALSAARSEWTLLVACDMPFVTLAVVDVLVEARAPANRWVCVESPEIPGRLEPMPGLYHRDLAATVERLLRDHPSFQTIFSHTAGLRVPVELVRRVDPDLRSLVSVNTPEDLARVGAALPTLINLKSRC